MRRLTSALFVIGVITASRVALADAPPPRRLQYTRGSGAELCPTEEDLRGRIVAHLGYDAFAGAASPAAEQVLLTIERRDARLVARIERRDANGKPAGKRELAGAAGDCGELASSAAFAVAFALDPLNAHEVPVEPAAAPPQSPPPSAPAAPSERVIAPPPPPPSAPLRLRLGVAALASVGAEPSATGGATALVGVAWRRWSLDLEGRGDLSATLETASAAAVHANVLAGSLVPCAALGVLRGCAIGSIGTLRGSSSGVSSAAQADSLWAAVGLRGGVEVPIGPIVKLRALAEPVAVLTRTTLVVADRAVWTSPTLALSLAIGAVVEIQ